MRKLALRGLVLTVVIGLLGLGSYAIAGGGTKHFKGKNHERLRGEPGRLDRRDRIVRRQSSRTDGTTLAYELTYSGLEGTVPQAHIHFGKAAINGGISILLCETATIRTRTRWPIRLTCPQSGTVTGDARHDRRDRARPAQGIEPGNLAEILAAMRAGHTYANVHSTQVRRRRDPRADQRQQAGQRLGGADD